MTTNGSGKTGESERERYHRLLRPADSDCADNWSTTAGVGTRRLATGGVRIVKILIR